MINKLGLLGAFLGVAMLFTGCVVVDDDWGYRQPPPPGHHGHKPPPPPAHHGHKPPPPPAHHGHKPPPPSAHHGHKPPPSHHRK